MKLEGIRQELDRIDAEIMRLLHARMEYAVRTKRFKREVTDPGREQEIIKRVRDQSRWLIESDFGERIFNEIIAESKRLQQTKFTLSGFKGEHGSFAENALGRWQSSYVPIPCTEFAEIFDGIESGALDSGIIPFESSTEGGIAEVTELLLNRDAQIIAEANHTAHYALLTLPSSDHRELKVVYSDPATLSHCRGFITRNKLEARPYYDAAGAAHMLAHERPTGAAVIASSLCADIYHLEILKDEIEDNPPPVTRYVMIAKSGESGGAKCTVSFRTPHRAGALLETLQLFSAKKINLTRLESLPAHGRRDTSGFIVDFEGAATERQVGELLEELRQSTTEFKLIGCYNVVA